MKNVNDSIRVKIVKRDKSTDAVLEESTTMPLKDASEWIKDVLLPNEPQYKWTIELIRKD